MLEAFSNLLTFKSARLVDDIEIEFTDVILLKPIGGILPGFYHSMSFNLNKAEAGAYNYEGDLISTGRFLVTPAT